MNAAGSAPAAEHAMARYKPTQMIRTGFTTPSDGRWSRRWRDCRPPEMLTYCRVCCAFESACALPSAVIRAFETSSRVLFIRCFDRKIQEDARPLPPSEIQIKPDPELENVLAGL